MEKSGELEAVNTVSPLSCRKVGITGTTWIFWTDMVSYLCRPESNY